MYQRTSKSQISLQRAFKANEHKSTITKRYLEINGYTTLFRLLCMQTKYILQLKKRTPVKTCTQFVAHLIRKQLLSWPLINTRVQIRQLLGLKSLPRTQCQPYLPSKIWYISLRRARRSDLSRQNSGTAIADRQPRDFFVYNIYMYMGVCVFQFIVLSVLCCWDLLNKLHCQQCQALRLSARL